MEFEEVFLTEDGKLTKKILTPGTGDQPKDGQIIEVHYTGTLLDGTKFDSSVDRGTPFTFTLGTGEVIKGWDIGMATMKLGEKSIFKIHPDLAYGEGGSGKIPADATLLFEVELLGFKDKKKEKWDFSDEERRVEALTFKNEGNAAFKSQNFADAKKKYEEAIDYVEQDSSPEALELKVPTYLNLSAVCTKLGEFKKAVENADHALKIDPKNVKAYFRKAAAHQAFGELQLAKEDLQKGLEIDPSNNDLLNEMQALHIKITKQNQKEKKLYGNMFKETLYDELSKTDYSDASNPVVFLDVQIGDGPVKRMEFELFSNYVPKTAENFRALCTGEKGIGKCAKPLHYKGSYFHRLIKDFMLQGGDFEKGDGTGGESIYGEKFEDENFKCKHLKRGFLSSANSGKNTNGSQFFITFKKTEWLDNAHVVFGCIKSGLEVLKEIEDVELEGEKPKDAIKIVDSGEVKKAKEN